jgi:hypothetical protein
MKINQNLVWVETKLNSTKFTSIENFNENIKLVEPKGKEYRAQLNSIKFFEFSLIKCELFNLFEFNSTKFESN